MVLLNYLNHICLELFEGNHVDLISSEFIHEGGPEFLLEVGFRALHEAQAFLELCKAYVACIVSI